MAALVLAVALRFESEIFFADLYAAEDVRPAAAVLALAVALYFEFHFFFADLYAAEDVLTAKAALTRGVLRLSESDLFTAAAALARGVFLLSESRFARFTILAWTRSFSLVLDDFRVWQTLCGRAWANWRCVLGGVTWSVDAAAVEGRSTRASRSITSFIGAN